MRGKATKACREPIEISTSPEINRTEKSMAVTKIIDSLTETFIISINVKKYSDEKEKKQQWK